MAITYTPNPIGQARTYSQDETGRRTCTRYFQAETSDPLIGPKAVHDACPVQRGMTYNWDGESDSKSYAVNISVNEDTSTEDGRWWIVAIQYSPFNAIDFNPTDPMTARPKISFTSTRFQVPALETAEEDPIPIVNSADDPFDPPVMIDQTRPLMTIVKNEAYFDPLLARDYHNAVNDAQWFGRPALEWKCLDITGDEATDQNGDRYWVVTYQFEMNPDTWIVKVLDEGMREINTSGKKVKILDEAGREISDPWPLNENGTKKAVGQPGEFLNYHLYREVDFTVLNLDDFYQDLVDSGLLH
jgi:hypothetical protein